ncbi:MAG: hypothetical protein ACI38Q_04210, partial [Candidatus Bruticola sp.]
AKAEDKKPATAAKAEDKKPATAAKAEDKKPAATAAKAEDKKPATAAKAEDKKPATAAKAEDKKPATAAKAEDKKPAAAAAKAEDKKPAPPQLTPNDEPAKVKVIFNPKDDELRIGLLYKGNIKNVVKRASGSSSVMSIELCPAVMQGPTQTATLEKGQIIGYQAKQVAPNKLLIEIKVQNPPYFVQDVDAHGGALYGISYNYSQDYKPAHQMLPPKAQLTTPTQKAQPATPAQKAEPTAPAQKAEPTTPA